MNRNTQKCESSVAYAETVPVVSGKGNRLCIPLILLFSAWGLFCVLFALSGGRISFPTGFPFEQIGRGLRVMSLSGNVGNAAAIAVFAVICLIPAALFIALTIGKKRIKADFLLLLCEILTVPTLYFSVNPGLLKKLYGNPVLSVTLIAGVFWSAVFAWIVLRVCMTGRSEENRYRILCGICLSVMVLLLYRCCYAGVADILAGLQSIHESNTDLSVSFFVTDTVTVLNGILGILPDGFVFVCLICALRLISSFREDKYSSFTVACGKKLAEFSRLTLCVTMLSCVVSNILQLLLSRWLLASSYLVILPLELAAICVILMILADYVAENAAMKQENGLFI